MNATTRQWVKVVGSDVRLDYPSKRVDHADGVHYHFEDDLSGTPRRVRLSPTILQDNGDGTYTSWGLGILSVGTRGRLAEGVQVGPLKNRHDRAALERIESGLRENAERAFRRYADRDGCTVHWGNIVHGMPGQEFIETFASEAEAIERERQATALEDISSEREPLALTRQVIR